MRTKKYTQEEAISLLKSKFPNFDYSKFKYINCRTKSIIICEKHGEIETSLFNAMNSDNLCFKCSVDNRIPHNKLTQDTVISNLKNKFPDLDFSKFVFKSKNIPSTIICPVHGEFKKSYYNLYEVGCNLCKKDNSNYKYVYTEEKKNKAINKLKEKFPNLDFSKFEYAGINAKSTIICPKHGEFQAIYRCFINYKYGCKKCYNEVSGINRSNKEALSKAIEKFPNLDFSKFEYKSRKCKSIVICPKHGEFLRNVCSLLHKKNKNGCPSCSKEENKEKISLKRLSRENAFIRLNETFPQFDFSKFKYVRSNIKSTVICKKHNLEFETTYNKLLYCGTNCPKCNSSGFSKTEKEIVEFIRTFYDGKIIENDRTIILNENTGKYLELDIYLPDISLAIEFNGKYYHSDERIKQNKNGFNSADEYHQYKTKKCKEKDIELIHIDEISYINNSNVILNKIKKTITKNIFERK